MSKHEKIDMEYNSEKEDIIIAEYGRNIQKMLEYARDVEDDRLRQAYVEKIIDLMMQINPQSRNMDDYKEKLWKHALRIGNYALRVTPPAGINPSAEDAHKRPEKIPYPVYEAKYRHYGHNIQVLIRKALEMPPGPKRLGFIHTIASYMKLAYKTWNRDHFITDEVIKSDIEALSEGQLSLDENATIENLAPVGGPNNSSSTSTHRRRPGGKSYSNGDYNRGGNRQGYNQGSGNNGKNKSRSRYQNKRKGN